ncbi:MAG: hypothetical protein K2Q18_08815 [Bdellovibrionales bacterium]|nr:hypothetical protein [Bdellovibrionales bacterium]
MKWLLITLVLLSLKTYSRDVIIDIDGIRHLCTPIGNGNGDGYQKCIDTAYRGPFSRDESTRLCNGAFDTSPAECATEAYRGVFSKEESIQLCVSSTSSTGPSDCGKVAYAGPFSKSETLELCQNNGTERRAVCAIDSYRGPYTKQESIDRCKGLRFANEKSLPTDKETILNMIKEANLKAFESKEYK